LKATLHKVVGNANLRSVKRAKAVAMGVAGGSLLLIGGSLLIPAVGASAQSSGGLPDGPGKALAAENCSSCHGIELVTAQRRTSEEWKDVVNRMISNGDTLTEEQYNEVVTYLATYLGKDPASGAVPASASAASDNASAGGGGG
jgi:mono/diheme cytochrome c family protein